MYYLNKFRINKRNLSKNNCTEEQIETTEIKDLVIYLNTRVVTNNNAEAQTSIFSRKRREKEILNVILYKML